ncbi:MAG: BMP family ABC transporter substrate-binding protein [Candidatus Kariarchaeaceae archaeon]
MSESTYAQNVVIGTVIIGIIVGAAIGYGGSVLTTEDESVPGITGKLKVGFIYVGPIGDFGWTNAHDKARVYLDEKYEWLETNYIESVLIPDTLSSIDFLVEDWGADVIITTSFDYMEPTIEAAEKHKDIIFFHVSGYLREENVGTVFADFYQLYYLNGLMAGALSQTEKIGYVATFPIPELIRHINAFHLGAQTINPNIETHVAWMLTEWYDPTTATNAANSLINDKDVDILAFTEDSAAVPGVAKDTAGVSVFSHYSPMQSYAPSSTISGQLVKWEVMYEDIIQKIFLGDYTNKNLENVDLLGLMKEKAVLLGGEFDANGINIPINPLFVDDLKAVYHVDPILGNVSVYDLVMTRVTQMSETNVGYEPFTGPLYAQNGTLMVEENERMTIFDLLSMSWFLGVDGGCVAASNAGCVVGDETP